MNAKSKAEVRVVRADGDRPDDLRMGRGSRVPPTNGRMVPRADSRSQRETVADRVSVVGRGFTASTLVVDRGREFFAKGFVEAASSAGVEIHYAAHTRVDEEGAVERLLHTFTKVIDSASVPGPKVDGSGASDE